MASLPSILVLGPDTVTAANPATPVQLVHACRQWGFAAVVPASWGDELIATDVIRRCASRPNRPVIQCSCPRVADLLAKHATVLDDAIFWLISPPVAVARYLRTIDPERDIHVTYAGGCPGASDSSIDECISPSELLAALSARGIDLALQSKVFEDVIPADRRRHTSSAGGLPEQHRLWDNASFRVSQPASANLTVSIAQLLLAEERLLIDLSPALGCVCRAAPDSGSETALHRSPSPIVVAGKIDLSRPAPTPPSPAPAVASPIAEPGHRSKPVHEETSNPAPVRASQSRPAYRRQSTWRRQSPRPGVVVARTSGVMLAVNDAVPLIRRPETRLVITALLVTAALIIGLWAGRRTAPAHRGAVGSRTSSSPSPTMQLGRSRSP